MFIINDMCALALFGKIDTNESTVMCVAYLTPKLAPIKAVHIIRYLASSSDQDIERLIINLLITPIKTTSSINPRRANNKFSSIRVSAWSKFLKNLNILISWLGLWTYN